MSGFSRRIGLLGCGTDRSGVSQIIEMRRERERDRENQRERQTDNLSFFTFKGTSPLVLVANSCLSPLSTFSSPCKLQLSANKQGDGPRHVSVHEQMWHATNCVSCFRLINYTVLSCLWARQLRPLKVETARDSSAGWGRDKMNITYCIYLPISVHSAVYRQVKTVCMLSELSCVPSDVASPDLQFLTAGLGTCRQNTNCHAGLWDLRRMFKAVSIFVENRCSGIRQLVISSEEHVWQHVAGPVVVLHSPAMT